jgi:ribonuclease HIII
VTQETFVGKLDPARAADLKERLSREGFRFRAIEHAVLAGVREGLSVALYGSGKLVVQGIGAREFAERALGVEAIAAPAPSPAEDVIGTDESGKGDYFGPLVVAAVYADPRARAAMARGEVDDSKKLSDETVRRLAAAIREKLPNAVVSLSPEEYNRAWESARNANRLLASLHAEAIVRVSRRVRCRRVLTDAFGDASLVRGALGPVAARFELRQRPRAESDPAVAAASILARDAFLAAMNALSEEFAVDLPLGAGENVDDAGRRFLRLHGAEALRRVAKLHFKNTQKLGRLF